MDAPRMEAPLNYAQDGPIVTLTLNEPKLEPAVIETVWLLVLPTMLALVPTDQR